MSEPGKDAGLAAAPTEKKIFTVGTLRYTTFGLAMVFIWLLWGDFCWTLLDGAIPGILPLKLNQMGASDTVMSVLIRTLGLCISFVFAPMVSFKSDRYRSRWGRRIPFLVWSTPFVGVFMILMGYYENLTQMAMGDAQHTVFLGFELSRTGVSLIVFAILLVGFDIANIFVNTVYWYLFNDVVPTQFLSRFLSLFRIMGGIAGVCYNWFIYEHALSHFRIIFVLGGIAYVAGFMLMCFFVKEGDYPPPPENIDKRKGFWSSVKTFARECFTHKFYWYFFLMGALFNLSWCSGLFQVLRNTGSLELTLRDLGRMGVYLSPVGFLLIYPAGWISDKYNPIRVYVAVTCVTVFTNVAQSLFIFFDWGPTGNLTFMYVITLFFAPFSAVQSAAEMPMYMRLLPKDRYGQFCSANGMVRAFAMMFGSILAGMYMEYIGAFPAQDYHVATNVISVTAARTQTSAWTEESVGPWKVEYLNNEDRSGTITVPGASAVKVYFKEIRTEHGWDRLTADAGHADTWSGNFERVYSDVKSGDTIALRLTSNMSKPGDFTVEKVAYQGAKTGEITRAGPLWSDSSDNTTFSLSGQITEKVRGEDAFVWWKPATWFLAAGMKNRAVPGVTVTFSSAEGDKVPAPVTTDASGSWAQNGFVRGTRYRIAAAKPRPDGTWALPSPKEDFSDAPKAPIKIEATWTEASEGWTEEKVGPWSAKYQNNWDRTATITVPGATAMKVYFEVLKTEAGGDRLTTDADSPDEWSGDFSESTSGVKSGDTLALHLTTGLYAKPSSNMIPRRAGDLRNDYEIRVTKVAYLGKKTGDVAHAGTLWESPTEKTFPLSGRVAEPVKPEHPSLWTRLMIAMFGPDVRPIPGALVTFKRVEGDGVVPEPVTTDAYGNWSQGGFSRGSKYLFTTAKPDPDGTWTFSSPTIGDWKYRYYPVWTIAFQAVGLALLIILYREWKRRGGDKGYTPPQV